MTINTKSPATFTTSILIGDPAFSPNGSHDSIPLMTMNNGSPVSAALEIQSTDSALLLPRMTTTQQNAIPNPIDGMIICNSTSTTINMRIGGVWQAVASGVGGDVFGPAMSTANDIAVFADNTGKVLADSGVDIVNGPVLAHGLAKGQLEEFALVNGNEIGNLNHIRFINDVGVLFVDSLMPVEFITNNYGVGSQTCSLFTGGLPSSSTTPSALVELQSTTGAFLLSRMTTTQKNALTAPAVGMMVYDTTLGNFSFYNGSWFTPGTGGGTVTNVSGTAGQIDVSNPTTTPVISIDPAYMGQTSITTLGTITTGTWHGSIIPLTYGGTNANLTASNGGIFYSTASAMAILAGTATANQIPLSGVSSAPSWSTATYPATTTINQLLYSSSANTITGLATANSATLVTSSTGIPSWTSSLTNGQILIGNTGATPSAATITAGSGISVTNGAGTITIATSGVGTVTSVSGTAGQITVSNPTTTPVVSIDPTYVGQTSITTLGTIATGTWHGTIIDLAHGGTNANLTASNGGVFYSTASAGAILAGTATANQALLSGLSSAPSWSTATYPATTTINQLLYSSATNTITGLSTANSATLATNSSGVPAWTASMTNGQVLIGNTGGTPTLATLTQGSGVTITNGAGSITIAATGSGGTVTSVSGTAGQIVVTSPTTTPVISIDPTYVGQTSITTLGTITTGTWHGSLIPLAFGGTNANLTASNGGIFYSTASAGAILAGTATANQVLLSGSSTTPAWSTATYPATTTANQLLYSSATNTIGGLTSANSATLVTSSAGVPSFTASMTNGQVLVGSTGATPTPTTITAGTGITITNGAGSITVASSGAPANIVDQTSSSVTMAVNTIYIIDNGASLVTLTLNATAALGSYFEIVGFSSGGWTIAQNSGQSIHFNSTSTTTGAGGSLSSTQQYNSVKIVCTHANTDFTVTTSQGNLTVV